MRPALHVGVPRAHVGGPDPYLLLLEPCGASEKKVMYADLYLRIRVAEGPARIRGRFDRKQASRPVPPVASRRCDWSRQQTSVPAPAQGDRGRDRGSRISALAQARESEARLIA